MRRGVEPSLRAEARPRRLTELPWLQLGVRPRGPAPSAAETRPVASADTGTWTGPPGQSTHAALTQMTVPGKARRDPNRAPPRLSKIHILGSTGKQDPRR